VVHAATEGPAAQIRPRGGGPQRPGTRGDGAGRGPSVSAGSRSRRCARHSARRRPPG
jgi:hypothetical protein